MPISSSFVGDIATNSLQDRPMDKSTLYVILAVALGLIVGFALVMYLLRPSPPTISVKWYDGPETLQIASAPRSCSLI